MITVKYYFQVFLTICSYQSQIWLQYCLEDGVNMLNDDDFVIHLDEETVLTEDSVRGILNFVSVNKHAIGQGNYSLFLPFL